MKAKLEFELPEENEEHLSAVNGSSWKSLAFAHDQALRSKLKHGNLSEDVLKVLEELREDFNSDRLSRGLSFD